MACNRYELKSNKDIVINAKIRETYVAIKIKNKMLRNYDKFPLFIRKLILSYSRFGDDHIILDIDDFIYYFQKKY